MYFCILDPIVGQQNIVLWAWQTSESWSDAIWKSLPTSWSLYSGVPQAHISLSDRLELCWWISSDSHLQLKQLPRLSLFLRLDGYFPGLPRYLVVTPLVLQYHFRDHTESLDDPYIEIWSKITNHHQDLHIGSTFWICSPIRHISIARLLYELIHKNSQAKRE